MKKVNKDQEWVYMWDFPPIMTYNYGLTEIFMRDEDPFPTLRSLQYFDGKTVTSYMVMEDLERLKREQSIKFLDKNYFNKYLEEYKQKITHWWQDIRRIEKRNYADCSNDDLVNDLKTFEHNIADALAYFGSTRPEFTFAGEERLSSILLEAGITAMDDFVTLITPVDFDDVQKEHHSWLKLIMNGMLTDEDILSHISKYPWLVFGEYEDNKIVKLFRDKATSTVEKYNEIVKKSEEDKEVISRRHSEIILKVRDVLKEEAVYLSSFLQRQSIERMNIKSYWTGSFYLARHMWKEVEKRIGIPFNNFFTFLSIPEMIDCIKGNLTKSDAENIIKERQKAFCVLFLPTVKKIELTSGEQASEVYKKYIKSVETNVTEIKGQVASPGKHTGIVKIVKIEDPESIRKSAELFNVGDVMVTGMTQPNMMIIANKAGAIVTDEGGITSHAAIISRELKIPCVVGCRTATKVFKDGDRVEVDAEKGVVRIIK